MIPGVRASTIMLEVVMFERPLFSGPVTRFSARSVHGELGILPRHTPLMALLLPCMARFQLPGEGSPRRLYLGGGFLEVQPNAITVLAEDALWPHEVDVEQARRRLEQASRRMKDSVLLQDREQAGIEWLQATAQLELWEGALATRGRVEPPS